MTVVLCCVGVVSVCSCVDVSLWCCVVAMLC